MKKQVAKTVVINLQGEVLLLKRGATAPTRALTWDLPGGIIDAGEDPLNTAIREIKEETGLDIKEIKFAFGTQKAWGYYWNIFVAKTDEIAVRISWEHDDYIWIQPSEIANLENIPPFFVEDIARAIKDLPQS